MLACGVTEPVTIIARTQALDAARKEAPADFEDLSTAFARANNLRDPEVGCLYDASIFDASESALAQAIEAVRTQVAEALEGDDYPAALAHLASLRKPIDEFFEQTMVMAEDQAVRLNRLRLLNAFVEVFANVADFGKLV